MIKSIYKCILKDEMSADTNIVNGGVIQIVAYSEGLKIDWEKLYQDDAKLWWKFNRNLKKLAGVAAVPLNKHNRALLRELPDVYKGEVESRKFVLKTFFVGD